MSALRNGLVVWGLVAAFSLASAECSEDTSPPLRQDRRIRCVNLRSLRNDQTFDLYQVGYWSHASFAMDVWKRHGVPYWYPRATGNVRVAGERYRPSAVSFLSSAACGAIAKADHQQPGNGATASANDDDLSTYWYAGDNRPSGELWIEFAAPEPVSSIRFLGWATGRHAPKDYRIGLILTDGTRREIASVREEKRMGEWISFAVDGTVAKGVLS